MKKAWGIQTKLVLSYLALGAVLIVLSILAARGIELQAQRNNAQLVELFRRSQALASLASAASEEGLSYVLVGDIDERERARGLARALGAGAREFSASAALTPHEAAISESVGGAVEGFRAASEAMFASYAATGAVPRDKYDGYEGALDRLIDRITELNTEADAQAQIGATRVRYRSDLFAIEIGAVVLVLALGAGMVLGRRITRPLLRLHDAVLAFGREEVILDLPERSDDEVGRLASAFREMTEATRHHIDTIRQGQQRLDDVFASISAILLVCDTEGLITAANPAACAYSGLPEDKLKGMRATALFRTESPHGSRSASALPIGGECGFSAADGTQLPVRVSLAGLRGRAGAGWVLIAHDLTEQRRMEAELREAHKLEAIGRLASGVAHEINTPVQFVGDSLQFVCDASRDLLSIIDKYHRAAEGPAEARATALAEAHEEEDRSDLTYLIENVPKAIERCVDGLGRIATIVRSMNQFAHPGRRELVSVDLNGLVKSTLVIARHEYKYVAELVTDFGELPPVACFPGEFNQAVLNVVVNAAHAIGEVVAGTEGKGTITVRTRLDGDHVVVSVADTGAGIPAAIRDKIFDPFFTTKEVGRGTGQGLAIARSIVLGKHGGNIRVESEVGRGTTFHLRIPASGVAGRSEAA